MKVEQGSQAVWDHLFKYNNGKLYWKNKFPKSKAVIGAEAGGVYDGRYRVVKIRGSVYYTHRIIWELFNGDIPCGYEIDHVNHDITDNRIENLRLVKPEENKRNIPLSSRNITGFIGVVATKYGYGSKVTYKGVEYWLGTFDSAEKANKARCDFIENHNFNFHKNHGAKK